MNTTIRRVLESVQADYGGEPVDEAQARLQWNLQSQIQPSWMPNDVRIRRWAEEIVRGQDPVV